MLCHFCQDLVFVPAKEVDARIAAWIRGMKRINEFLEIHFVSIHQPSRKALELSAGRGCRVCALIWFELFQISLPYVARQENDDEVLPIILSTDKFSWDEKAGALKELPGYRTMLLHYGKSYHASKVHWAISDDLNTTLNLSCVLSTQSEEQISPIGSAVDSHTGSEHNMSLIKIWLQECREKHWLCKMEHPSQSSSLLPTRVIQLETDGQAHIVETMGTRTEYLTLSYCWGHGKKLLCTRKSGLYEKFKQRLPVDDTMPRTFRDALQVTRALGFRYLWIDALCIIQDDPEDVGKEMAKMGDIYRQSSLTILANNGPDTDSGLFSERDARGSKACNVRLTEKRGTACIRGSLSITPRKRYYHTAVQTRGWVLQEEVLSGRLLQFRPNEVDWSCVTTYARESHPCMEKPELAAVSRDMYCETNPAMRLIVRRPEMFNKIPYVSDYRRNHFDVWYAMVGYYGHRTLSVESDKLLAIAGLAGLMQKNYNLTYVTGLWKEDLQVGLCWHVIGLKIGGSRPNDEDFPDYLAPSWSWASAHGMAVDFPWVSADSRRSREGVQVVNVEVSQLPGAPASFGYIKFAKLSIRTWMRRIVLIPRDNPFIIPEKERLTVKSFDKLTNADIGEVHLDSIKLYEDVLKQYQNSQLDRHSYPTAESTPTQAIGTRRIPSDGYEAWAVPCLVEKTHKKRLDLFAALILIPLNADKREYRRIGLMLLKGKECKGFLAGKGIHEDGEIIHIF